MGQVAGDRAVRDGERDHSQVSEACAASAENSAEACGADSLFFLPSCAQVWRPLRVEQSGDVHPQRAESAALPRTLRRSHHPQPEEQRVHLQDHFCQGEEVAKVVPLCMQTYPRPPTSPPQSRYWGSEANKNEVQGSVLDQSGSVIHRFGGLWHEGIFCDTLPTPKCVWKPSRLKNIELLLFSTASLLHFLTMRSSSLPADPPPKDHLIYYGFSAFAMELNQLTADLKPLLPPTDSRLRPDQRSEKQIQKRQRGENPNIARVSVL